MVDITGLGNVKIKNGLFTYGIYATRMKQKCLVSDGQSESSEVAFSQVHSSFLPVAVDKWRSWPEHHKPRRTEESESSDTIQLVCYLRNCNRDNRAGQSNYEKLIESLILPTIHPYLLLNGISVELVLTLIVGFVKGIYEEICMCSSCYHSLLLISE